MTDIQNLVTENLDVWTSAVQTKSGVGRGNRKKLNLYGIKKLRELILELAVRGKLVPQDENDEPASVLLEKITAEKEQLIKEKKIKKLKKLPEIGADDKPFELPKGWEFVRLQEIIHISSGNGLTSAKMEKDGNIPVYGGNGITGYHNKINVLKETLVIGRVGFYCGSVHITPNKAWVTDNAFITTFSENNIFLNFLYWLLKGTNLKENDNATAQPVISGRKVYPIVIGLPTLSEQHRIVSKVDELMALCDQLEQQTKDSITAHKTLVENLLATLTNSKNTEDLTQNWYRISDHFDTLFTTEDSIDQLKRTVIQLFATGSFSYSLASNSKMQSLKKGSDHGSTRKTIMSIAASDKKAIISSGEAKEEKIKPLVIVNPYSITPEGWVLCKLNDVTSCLDHRRVPIKKSERSTGNVPYYGANGPVGFIGEKLFDEELVLVVEDETFIGRVKPFSYLINGPSWVNNHAHVLKCTSVIIPKFLNLILSYYPFIKLTSGTTGRKKLTKNTLLQIPLLIAPLDEQYRIIAKVDQLMELCNLLQSRISENQTTQLHLAECIVEGAVN